METQERAGQRRDSREKAYPEILSLLRGLVAAAAGADDPAVRAARRWLARHCPGCGMEKSDQRDACDDCRRTWRETLAAGGPAG